MNGSFCLGGCRPAGSRWSRLRGAVTAVPTSTVTIYGSGTLLEQGPGAVGVMITRVDAVEPLDATGATTVDVSGHEATIEGDGETLVVTVPVVDHTFTVTGAGISRGELLRIAAAAVDGRPIEPLLSSGLVEVAHGSPDDTSGPTGDGLSLGYGTDAGAGSVTINQRPGRHSELGLVLTMMPAPSSVNELTVRGRPGLLATWRGNADLEGLSDLVQWIEPSGMLVTVWVDGLDESARDQLIDGLRASTDAEIDELVATYEPPATSVVRPPADNGPQPVEIVVAEGDRGANHWRVTAREDHGPPTEVRYEDDYTRFGNAAASAADELEQQDDGGVAVGGDSRGWR